MNACTGLLASFHSDLFSSQLTRCFDDQTFAARAFLWNQRPFHGEQCTLDKPLLTSFIGRFSRLDMQLGHKNMYTYICIIHLIVVFC